MLLNKDKWLSYPRREPFRDSTSGLRHFVFHPGKAVRLAKITTATGSTEVQRTNEAMGVPDCQDDYKNADVSPLFALKNEEKYIKFVMRAIPRELL